MKQLTERQKEVLDLLVKYQNEHGYAPTITELARLMGVVSPNAATQQLRSLQRKGAITIIPRSHRGISINCQPPQPQKDKRLMELNLNTTVKLKLTDVAIAELKRKHDEMISDHPGLSLEFSLPAEDENGMVSMQLWSVMSSFGALCYCGADHPFEMHLMLEDE